MKAGLLYDGHCPATTVHGSVVGAELDGAATAADGAPDRDEQTCADHGDN
jgi:hypothetical protein